MIDRTEVTALIQRWRGGDLEPLNEIIASVYDELLQIARRRLRGERQNHTLNTQGLVHEAYVRLAQLKHPKLEGKSHFYALATQVMRNILVDHAKARRAGKRGADRTRVELHDTLFIDEETTTLILELEDALQRLRAFNQRWEEVVAYRFFGGFSIEETARELGVSLATANRDWQKARAWLNQAMTSPALSDLTNRAPD